MSVALRPDTTRAPFADVPVAYHWDAATGILAARIAHRVRAADRESQFALAGRDGAWITLGIAGDRLLGVDIVIWPQVREVPMLVPPVVEPVGLSWRRLASAPQVRALSAPLVADVSLDRGLVRLRVAGRRVARTVREAQDVCIDLDAAGTFAGVWLLNVPPCPEGA
jgi:hypothetical protein